MSKAKLYYDKNCNICSEFQRLVKRKLGDSIEYVPIGAYKSDAEYVDENGQKYVGSKAIEKLATDHPQIKDFVWILPEKLKVTGLKVAYKVGSVVKKSVAKVHHGCNCGKH